MIRMMWMIGVALLVAASARAQDDLAQLRELQRHAGERWVKIDRSGAVMIDHIAPPGEPVLEPAEHQRLLAALRGLGDLRALERALEREDDRSVALFLTFDTGPTINLNGPPGDRRLAAVHRIIDEIAARVAEVEVRTLDGTLLVQSGHLLLQLADGRLARIKDCAGARHVASLLGGHHAAGRVEGVVTRDEGMVALVVDPSGIEVTMRLRGTAIAETETDHPRIARGDLSVSVKGPLGDMVGAVAGIDVEVEGRLRVNHDGHGFLDEGARPIDPVPVRLSVTAVLEDRLRLRAADGTWFLPLGDLVKQLPLVPGRTIEISGLAFATERAGVSRRLYLRSVMATVTAGGVLTRDGAWGPVPGGELAAGERVEVTGADARGALVKRGDVVGRFPRSRLILGERPSATGLRDVIERVGR
jgi:hypothetical protein